jgi:hypothetical protein
LEKNFLLPSINEFGGKYAVGRDTVEKVVDDPELVKVMKGIRNAGYSLAGRWASYLSTKPTCKSCWT